MKDLSKIMRQLTLVGQLGLSLATPLLLCLFVCYLLISKLSAPAWIYIPGFILGIGSSMMTAWKFYTAVISRDNKKKKDSTISFNDHV
ncbi:MAG: AtpZ/AtpI family protein [Lachnospiraceae bacterium]|nr:AtpZ/AtpI family protein [Lachnospiraceae bacterium]